MIIIYIQLVAQTLFKGTIRDFPKKWWFSISGNKSIFSSVKYAKESKKNANLEEKLNANSDYFTEWPNF